MSKSKAGKLAVESLPGAYKGYSLKLNPFDGVIYISKGGYHIGSAGSYPQAKAIIDEIVG